MSADMQAAAKPRLRPDVVLGPALRTGSTAVHHVKDRRTGWFYKVGPREHFIMSRLDGAHTLDEIAAAYDREFARTLGPQQWAQIFTMLGRRQLLDDAADEAALARLTEAHQATRAGDRSLLRRRFAVTFPASWCATAAARLRFVWRLRFAIPVVLAALAVEGYALGHLGGLASDARAGAHPWQIIPADVAGVWLLVLAHELGHGLTCAHYGGSVTEIGIMWRFPMLAPYCKTDDMTLFSTRRARVATAFAGMFAGLAALPVLWAWWTLAAPDSASRSVAAGLLLFTAVTTLTNLVPFLGLDGYHMLTHALGYADLRAESRRYWFRLPFRGASADRSVSRASRIVFVVYGVATVAFFGGGYAFLSVLWFHRLERWMSPALAGVALGAETLLILVLFGARRSRAATHRQAAA